MQTLFLPLYFFRRRRVKLETRIRRRGGGTREPSRCCMAFRYLFHVYLGSVLKSYLPIYSKILASSLLISCILPINWSQQRINPTLSFLCRGFWPKLEPSRSACWTSAGTTTRNRLLPSSTAFWFWRSNRPWSSRRPSLTATSLLHLVRDSILSRCTPRLPLYHGLLALLLLTWVWSSLWCCQCSGLGFLKASKASVVCKVKSLFWTSWFFRQFSKTIVA